MENKDGEGDEDMPYVVKEMPPCHKWRGKAQHDTEEEETGAYKTAGNLILTEREGEKNGAWISREGFS